MMTKRTYGVTEEKCTNLQMEKAVKAYAKKMLKKQARKELQCMLIQEEDYSITFMNPHGLVMVKDYPLADRTCLINPNTGEEHNELLATYPNRERLIPTVHEDNKLLVDVAVFKESLTPIAKQMRKGRGALKVAMTSNGAILTPYDHTLYFVETKIDLYDNEVLEPFSFGVNPHSLLDMFIFFSRLKVEKVEMYFISPVRPIVFKSDLATVLIMPCRLH